MNGIDMYEVLGAWRRCLIQFVALDFAIDAEEGTLTKKCSSCGAINDINAITCEKCGKQFREVLWCVPVLVKIGEKMERRNNIVMTRLNDEDLKQIEALIEVEAFKSKSEAVAFFIKEGINARKDLFQKIMPTVEKIRQLKDQAKISLTKE